MKTKTFRNLAFILHRYIGLAVGLLLAFVGLTGSLLVFEPEISEFLTTCQFGQVIPQEQQLSSEKILDIAKTAYPSLQPVPIHPPEDRYHPYTLQMTSPDANPNVYLDGSKEVFINPYTGVIMGDRLERTTFYRLFLNLHYRLFAEDLGIAIVGIAAFLLFILSIAGVILWSGWRKLITGFKIKWNAHPKRVNFDIHKLAGIIAAAFFTMIAFTGFCWNFYDFTTPLIYAATFTPPPPEPPVSKLIIGQNSVGLSQILKQVDASLPGTKTTVIYLPASPNDIFIAYKKFPQDSSDYNNAVYFDQYSGKVLQVEDGRKQGLGDRVLDSFTLLHFGTFGRLPTRILYVFVGLAPLILLPTGFVMWRYRYRAKSSSNVEQLRL